MDRLAAQAEIGKDAGSISGVQPIRQRLNGHRCIALCAIVDQYIGSALFSDGLANQFDRITSHLRDLLDNLRVWLSPLFGLLVGHLERREEA